jgi:hypothetical protein
MSYCIRCAIVYFVRLCKIKPRVAYYEANQKDVCWMPGRGRESDGKFDVPAEGLR